MTCLSKAGENEEKAEMVEKEIRNTRLDLAEVTNTGEEAEV